MELKSALLLFIIMSYAAGVGVVALVLYLKSILAGVIAGGLGYLILLAIRKVAVTSVEEFLYDGVGFESNKLCHRHSEEALTLLATGKYEELKILLIGKSAEAEDEIRTLNLAKVEGDEKS